MRLKSVNVVDSAVGLAGSGGRDRDRRGLAVGSGGGGFGRGRAAAWASCNWGHGAAGWARRAAGGVVAAGQCGCSAVAFADLPGGGARAVAARRPG